MKTRSVIVVVAVSLVLISTIALQAQPMKKGAGQGYFMFGASMLDVDDLNSSLAAAGYSEFSKTFYSLGGGGHAILNKLVLGGQGHSLIRGDEEATVGNDTYKTSLVGFVGYFDVGYVLYSKGGFNLRPMLGLGGGGLSLQVSPTKAPAFDDVLSDPKQSSTLVTGGWLVKFSLALDYLVVMQEEEEGVGGLVLGLEVGYGLAPVKGDWSLEDVEITGGPDLGVTGPFIRFMFGGGGRSLK